MVKRARQVWASLVRRLGGPRHAVAVLGLVAAATIGGIAVATFTRDRDEPEAPSPAATASQSGLPMPDQSAPLASSRDPLAAAIGQGTSRDTSSELPRRLDPDRERRFVARQLVVRFDPDLGAREIAQIRSRFDLRLLRRLPIAGAELVATETTDVTGLARRLQETGAVLYAEPNFIYTASATTPNDPLFPQLWGLNNTGQTIGGGGAGVADADIDAPEAWDSSTGTPDVVVAVVDTGVAADHPDLAGNIWANPGETGNGRDNNGLDDDGNGYVDDHKGQDFVDDDNDPADPNGHGTHVAGTIGARGGNGIGLSGVTWRVGIMALRVLDAAGAGTSADIATAFDYAGAKGAHVVNASLGGPSPSQVVLDAIARYPETLFVVAAGNDAANNDTTPMFPCNYEAANVICVAATDNNDKLASFSNYGATTVDLGAPGRYVLSALPSWSVPFSDDFEGDLSQRWTAGGLGGAWGRALDRYGYYLADSPGANYAPSVDHWLATGPLDLSGLSGCRVTYFLKLASEANKDVLRVEATTEGSSWSRVATWGGSTSGKWIEMSDDLSAFDGKTGVRLRLRFLSNATIEMAGADLDDVRVVCILQTYSGDEYGYMSGTSMAAPHVAGAAALLRAAAPSLPSADIKAALFDGADPVSILAGKTVTGGRLNIASSLSRVMVTASSETPQPASTASPSPATTIETRDHQRSVGLRLRNHLVARGRVTVSDGYSACRSRVRVVIRRNGVVVARTTTDRDGYFRVRLADRPGRYRARAVRLEVGEGQDRCLAADSPIRKHGH